MLTFTLLRHLLVGQSILLAVLGGFFVGHGLWLAHGTRGGVNPF